MKRLAALLIAVLPSPLKLACLRLAGLQIGRDVRIGFGTLLLVSEGRIEDGASIGRLCIIRARSFHMGRRATIANFVRISVHAFVMRSQTTISSQNEIAGDPDDARSTIQLGTASWILPHCYVNVVRPVKLGRNVGVGGGSYLFTHGLWLSKLDGFPVSHGEIVIEDDVWLPWGCFVMPGLTIGSRAIVGACSVVTKSLPPGVLAAGVPAKILRDKSNVDLTQEQRVAILAEITESLAARKAMDCRIEAQGSTVLHHIGGQPVLKVHLADPQAWAGPPTLNVVFGALDRQAAAGTALWSLLDYASSPCSVLSSAALEWLDHARGVGVRFYPCDEDTA